jgi:hypothetical protein
VPEPKSAQHDLLRPIREVFIRILPALEFVVSTALGLAIFFGIQTWWASSHPDETLFGNWYPVAALVVLAALIFGFFVLTHYWGRKLIAFMAKAYPADRYGSAFAETDLHTRQGHGSLVAFGSDPSQGQDSESGHGDGGDGGHGDGGDGGHGDGGGGGH